MSVQKWTGRETRLLRQALRLSVRGFAEYLGLPARTVSRWEHYGSGRTPRPEYQAILDTALRRADDEARERFQAAASDDAQTKARGASTPEIITEAAADAASFLVWWETRPSSGVEALFAELRRLSTAYLDGPPEPVISQLAQLRAGIFQLLRAPQSPKHLRDLHLAAGYACTLMAWLSGDVGQLAAASTHTRAASLFGDTTASTELQAWIWATRSKTSFWLGDYGTAARHAHTGLDQAPASEVRVLLAAQAADAWATAGAKEPARQALHAIEAARDSVKADGDVGGLLSCDTIRQHNYESGVYQLLGEPDKAIQVAENALTSSQAPTRSYATDAQIRLNQVDVFLDGPDLSAAIAALQPVLHLPKSQRLATIVRRVSQIGVQQGGTELGEACRDFAAASPHQAA